MTREKIPATILIADDDPEDRMMIKEAIEESFEINNIRFVVDGEDLINYLFKRGEYKSDESCSKPDLILLDLNMPKKDGREALKEIKLNSELKNIPTVAFTTSKNKDDIYKTYSLGINSYITKPESYKELIDITRQLVKYWFEISRIPGN